MARSSSCLSPQQNPGPAKTVSSHPITQNTPKPVIPNQIKNQKSWHSYYAQFAIMEIEQIEREAKRRIRPLGLFLFNTLPVNRLKTILYQENSF
jgi:hypothetical protein